MQQNWSRAKGALAALAAPPGLFLLAFVVAPMAIVWLFSFGETRDLTQVVFTGSLESYARTLSPLYLGIIWKSLWIATAVTLICLAAGFPVALAIAFAPPRLKLWLLVLVMLPFCTNLLIRTFALMAVLREQGHLNQVLGAAWGLLSWTAGLVGVELAPFEPLPLLHNTFAMMAGLVYVQLPFMVLPLFAALERMDRSLLEASLDLGAGRLRTLWNIVLPLAAPGVAAGVLITFIPTVGSFLAPDLLGGPDSQMIASVIERQFKRANDWPFGAALSFLLIYLTLALVALRGLVARRRSAPR